MLTIDEIWLTQADRTRLLGTVSAIDIRVENALFDAESLLRAADAVICQREARVRVHLGTSVGDDRADMPAPAT